LLFIILLSCNNAEESASKVTWIGGEIVNPKIDYVILSRDHDVLDTIPLDENNFFHYRIDSLSPGLYSFKHNEYQILYLEPGDSLMLRLNTADFDESLAFTGKGAERNSLLMEFFLMNEAETQLLPSYYHFAPNEFQKKMDSLSKIRTELYNEFVLKNPNEKSFREIAKANIAYDNYIKKELYISTKFGNKEFSDESIPHEFYEHRNHLDLGNDKLCNFYPYYRFLNKYFDNLAFSKYKQKDDFDRLSFIHNYNKLKIIDSLITNESLKNSLLKGNVGLFLVNGKDVEKVPEMMALFDKINTNKDNFDALSELSRASLLLSNGNTIPNVLLINSENTVKDLHSIIRKPTVLYFWSYESVIHFKNIHSKAAELSSKYPEYDFIGINTDTHFKKWLSIVKNAGYNRPNEYQFDNIEDAEKKLVINSANKAIILDKNGAILQGNSSLFSQNIESILLSHLNE
jgi:hypothetical protein